MATTEDLGTSPLGHVLVGSSGSSVSSPGCWMARNSVLPSGVKAGPVSSASTGALANWQASPPGRGGARGLDGRNQRAAVGGEGWSRKLGLDRSAGELVGLSAVSCGALGHEERPVVL